MAKLTDDDRGTIIGQSMRVQGNLSGDEDLHVLGRVEGSIELQRTLLVAESGIVKAEVTVRNAVISGVIVGNVTASESVELTREGRMVGDIAAPRIIIVDGASFRGAVDMGDIENMPAPPPRSERKTPRPIAASRPEAKDDGATEVEVAAEKSAAPAAARTPAPASAPVRTTVSAKPGRNEKSSGKGKKKKPSFLDPPKARGLPKKQKSRVVVKRK